MFDRNYMDYHQDRFSDFSLMFFENNRLAAILPASRSGNTLSSHAGLTFGGFITDNDMKQHRMNDCLSELLLFSKTNGIDEIIYKMIPHIYHRQPSEEDKYALYSLGGRIITIDASTYINFKDPIKLTKGRKAQISRAKRENVIVKEDNTSCIFDKFIEMENHILWERHNTTATHTGKELSMLQERFPENIHLFGGFLEDELIAGTVIYEYENVIHTQYMASNDIAREIGGLDIVINTVIEKYKNKKDWLDFGISTEHNRIYLNEGLISQKESFGGRTGTYEIWRIPVTKK